jgi:hypothetical protein
MKYSTEELKGEIIGRTFSNNSDQEFKVLFISRRSNSNNAIYRIKFIKTGYETDVEKVQIKRGKIKDKMELSVFGVGFMGNVKMVDFKKEYSVWSGMLERCYDKNSPAYKYYGEIGISVCDHWLCFENFLNDIVKVEGFNKELFEKGEITLDKDKKQFKKENKIYSLETCAFLSTKENNENRDYDRRRKVFYGLSPKGEEFKITELKEFVKSNNLITEAIRNCLAGRAKTHLGWKFYYKED